MMYTKSTFGTHEYSKKHTNMQVDLSKTNTDAIAVIVAVSRERGVEHMMQSPMSINKATFKLFLHELRQKNLFDDIAIMMDNLMVHKSKEMQERLDELGFVYQWTPVYSP